MNKEKLKSLVNSNIVHLDDEVFSSLEELMQDTLETNEKFNLTAIKNKEEFRELMIYDSLLPLKYINLDGKKVLDVGTGAGYPGLPLAIASKGQFTLLDATAKKITHINEFVKAHNLKNVVGVNARVEDFAKNNREQFDIVIARAVSPLNMLLELCVPLVKVNGTLIAMKGSNVQDEIKEAKKAFKVLNSTISAQYQDYLPVSESERNLLIIKKEKETAKKYPRSFSEIKSHSL